MNLTVGGRAANATERILLMAEIIKEDRPFTRYEEPGERGLERLKREGNQFKVDNAELGRAGFVRCVPNGCVAEVVMDDNLITKLKTGQSATFIIFQTPEEGIGFPISLKGLGEGFDKLP